MELLGKQLEGILPEPVPSNESTKKKSKTKTGVKRALMLIIILTCSKPINYNANIFL